MAWRVMAKLEFHFGELFRHAGFNFTNLTGASRAIVHFYNQRRKAEHWIKEGRPAVKMTRLSCHRFRANEVRLAQRHRLQTRQPMAATGATKADR
jgi:hypothetical protein